MTNYDAAERPRRRAAQYAKRAVPGTAEGADRHAQHRLGWTFDLHHFDRGQGSKSLTLRASVAPSRACLVFISAQEPSERGVGLRDPGKPAHDCGSHSPSPARRTSAVRCPARCIACIGGWLEALDDAIGERVLHGDVLSRDNVVTTESRFSRPATRLQGLTRNDVLGAINKGFLGVRE
jgi:hypothetical protein